MMGLEGPVEFKLLRFIDMDPQLRPGRKYRYRVQLILNDVNHNQRKHHLAPEVVDAREASAERKNNGIITTDWSEPTPTVGIPLPGNVLTADVRPGSGARGPMAEIIVTTIDGQEAFEAITKETLSRGDVANIFKTQLWVLEPSGTARVKKSNYTLETGIAVADMRGGASVRDRTDLNEPAEILLIDPAGQLYVRRELDDETDVKMYNFLLEIDKKKPEDVAGQAPGYGGGYGGGYGRGGGRGN
jgi:hypothetical protein